MEVTTKTIELLQAMLRNDLCIEIFQTVVNDLRSPDFAAPIDQVIEGAIRDWDK